MATAQESSYRKSIVLAAVLALAAAAVAAAAQFLAPPAAGLIATVATLGSLIAALIVVGGCIVVTRDRRLIAHRPDLFLESNEPRRESALAARDGFRSGPLRRLAGRVLLGHDLLVGDEVEVRTLPEILATLDARGCVDGIPYQSEMTPFCGRRQRVFRSLDKIYDFGRTRRMRRLDGFVLLAGLRCSGVDHGSCEARCYLIWSTKWLKRPGSAARAAAGVAGRDAAPAVAGTLASGEPRYRCQFTELHAATRELAHWGAGKELRPLVAGNFTLRAWLVGLLTRVFNIAQRARGGVGFPVMPEKPATPLEVAGRSLAAGDFVIVRPIEQIAKTLNRHNKNRGLWFDQDMIKHCGTRQRVLARADRIIDDATGEMRVMKTPCILLDGIDYSGEFLNFNTQHDPFFWREAWLEKAD